MNATGMGHKLAHKPHDKGKSASEKPAVSAHGLTKAAVKSHKVIHDQEYRDALRHFKQHSLTKIDT